MGSGEIYKLGRVNATGLPESDLCRVTVVTPSRSLDLGLPADLPIADMVPTLLRVAGDGLADAMIGRSGWALQRLGDKPFDLAMTLSQLSVRDGEVLHLRPRGLEMPDVAFDDVADAIATGVKERTNNRWQPGTTRIVALGVGTVLLVTGAAALLVSGPPWTGPAIEAAVVATLLLLGAAALSRAAGDAVAGAVLGYAALPFGFLAGLLLPARAVGLAGFETANLLAAFGVTMMLATAAGFAVVNGLPIFLGVAGAASCGLLGATVTLAFDLSGAGIAAVLAALALGMTTMVPGIAFRLAGLPLPALPTTAEELRQEGAHLDGRMVLDRTVIADRFCTGLLGAVALVAMGAQILLVAEGTGASVGMSLALSCALLMRARAFEGRGQRLWLFVAGLAGIFLLALAVAASAPTLVVTLVILPGALVAAVTVIGLGVWMPERKATPLWGWLADIGDIVLTLALMPLALAVLDVYMAIRVMVS